MRKGIINTDWFERRLLDLDKTRVQLAAALGKDAVIVTRIFQGKRPVKGEEIDILATFFAEPRETIMFRLGMSESPTTATSRNKVTVIGSVEGDDCLLHPGDLLKKDRTTTGPADLPKDAVAVLMKTAGSACENMDGWVLFYVPCRGVNAETIGRLSLVSSGRKTKLRYIRKGYERGTFNLVHPCNPEKTEENVAVKSASPILWVRV